MRFQLVTLCALLFTACASDEVQEAPQVDSTAVSTEAPVLEMHQEYRYLIRDLKTGKEFELSQEEYLNSKYLGNPAYEVKELPMAQ